MNLARKSEDNFSSSKAVIMAAGFTPDLTTCSKLSIYIFNALETKVGALAGWHARPADA